MSAAFHKASLPSPKHSPTDRPFPAPQQLCTVQQTKSIRAIAARLEDRKVTTAARDLLQENSNMGKTCTISTTGPSAIAGNASPLQTDPPGRGFHPSCTYPTLPPYPKSTGPQPRALTPTKPQRLCKRHPATEGANTRRTKRTILTAGKDGSGTLARLSPSLHPTCCLLLPFETTPTREQDQTHPRRLHNEHRPR